MKNGSYGQLADLQTKKFKNILAEELKCSGKQIPETKTNTTHWAFFRKFFGETKSIEQDLWPVITKHLSNSALSPVLVYHQCLIIWCLAALSLTFPAYVTFLVSVLITVYLYARHQQTVQNRTPDFNPNRLGNMASCCCCCHESHKILQSQQLLFSPSCLSVNPEKVWKRRGQQAWFVTSQSGRCDVEDFTVKEVTSCVQHEKIFACFIFRHF